jgi:hypothetical protein
MGWKERQRRQRVAPVADLLRTTWARMTPQEQITFLAEITDPGPTEPPRRLHAGPDAPVWSQLAAEHGNPLAHAMLTPTGLLPLYVGRRSQAEQEQALASIGATTPGGAL